MGWLQDIVGTVAPIAGSFFGGPVGGAIGGLLGGAISGGGSGGSKQTGTDTTTQQQKLDPRIESMLFGGGGNTGLLSKYQGYLDQPQNPALARYGEVGGKYLENRDVRDMDNMHDTASRMLGGQAAPTVGSGAWNAGEKINAPSQNGIDLKGAFDSLIYGAPGANPYLTGAIGKGINQSTNAFTGMQQSATDNLMKTVLPSIRSNSVLAGQYGGSRQGIAEGNAIGDFGKAMAQATGQFGQNNTDAAVSAQAGAYDADRNRQLAAAQGLSSQQASQAQQEAMFRQQANMQNQLVGQDAAKTNANLAQQQQQINNTGSVAGSGVLSGLLDKAYGAASNADNAGVNRATQVNGLLQPYLDVNGTKTSSEPIYSNPAGNALGGGLLGSLSGGAGKNLADQMSGWFGGSKSGQGVYGGGKPGQTYDGYGWV